MTIRSAVTGAVLVVGLVAASAALAQSAAVYRKFKGQIIVSDREIPVSDSDAEMVKTLKRIHKTSLDGSGGTWSFYFMAFLNKKPGTSQLTVAFYDLSGGKRKMVTYKDIGVDASSTIVNTDFEIGEDDGIKKGTKYELAVVDLSTNKEVVFAKAQVTLK